MAEEPKRQSMKEDIIEQIEKLDVLREKGFITSQAYENEKLNYSNPLRSRASVQRSLDALFSQELLHLFLRADTFHRPLHRL